MNQADLNIFYHQVHQNVASKIGIEDFEWKSISELEKEIQSKNTQVASKVREFIETYEAWYKVHEKIEKAASSGKLSLDENNDLMNAIKERDSKRTALIDELAKH